MVFGKLLFGFILGNIASTLANAEIRRVKYEEKLGAIQVRYISLSSFRFSIFLLGVKHNRCLLYFRRICQIKAFRGLYKLG